MLRTVFNCPAGGVVKQDVEKGLQLCSRIVQRLNVRRERARLGGARGGLGKDKYASPSRHCRLTYPPACTSLALTILRAVHLAAALLDILFEHPVEGGQV